MRLNRFMATCGVASRRKCDEFILQGKVRVNAKVVKQLGVEINPDTDIVAFEGKPLRLPEEFSYIMLNKPNGYITSTSDPQNRKTVMTLLPKIGKRIFPVGRLDFNSSGLLLFTDDGALAQQLMHPSFELGKTYLAIVDGTITMQDLKKIRNGVDIGGFKTSKAQAFLIKTTNNQSLVKIIIHEGKNRQVRRMFDAIGFKVKSLKRVAIGKLVLGSLESGKWRYLTTDEIKYLKSATKNEQNKG